MVKNKTDWQKVFGKPDASFSARFDQTLLRLEEGKPMKKFTVRTAALVLALLVALTAVAYALTGGWGVADYLQNRYGREIPKDFKSDYAQTLTQTVGGVTFSIRDAYIDHNDLYAIVTLAREDGESALFLAGDISKTDTIDNLYLDGRTDSRTIQGYADEMKLPIQEVNFWFEQGDEYLGGGMDIWLEEDGTTAMALIANDIKVADGTASFVWCAQVIDEAGEKVRGHIEINLPAVPQTEKVIEIGKPVEGIDAVLDRIFLYTGALGTRVELEFSIPDDATARAFVMDNIWFELIDPATGERIPEGVSLIGSIDQVDATHLRQTGDSISAAWQGDTLILRAYDCWEKTRFGSVEVKIK